MATPSKRDSFRPPRPVRAAVRRALDLRDPATDDNVGATLHRARRLMDGEAVPLSTIRRMGAFFKRADADHDPTQFGLWGGEPGREWVAKVLGEDGDEPVAKAEPDEPSDTVDITCEIAKVDDSHGIVFGYAIVCNDGGDGYFDVQGDHIPESAMLDATVEFMKGDRHAKVMHQGDPIGRIVYGFPITEDIAKALGMAVERTGFVVGMQPDDPEVLAKFRTGELTGFSIGGRRIAETVVEE